MGPRDTLNCDRHKPKAREDKLQSKIDKQQTTTLQHLPVPEIHHRLWLLQRLPSVTFPAITSTSCCCTSPLQSVHPPAKTLSVRHVHEKRQNVKCPVTRILRARTLPRPRRRTLHILTIFATPSLHVRLPTAHCLNQDNYD